MVNYYISVDSLYWFGVIVGCMGFIYYASNYKSAQKQYLLPSKELIEQLKGEPIIRGTETYYPTRAKKTLQ